MVEIRRARPGDIEALIAMGRALHDESPRYQGKGYKPEKLRALAGHLQGSLLTEQAAIFVADDGGELVGMFVAVIAERWYCDERYMTDLTVYVKPERRGGTVFFRLVRAAEAWARVQGLPESVLGVSTEVHPERTVCAYERLGYTLAGYTMIKSLHGD